MAADFPVTPGGVSVVGGGTLQVQPTFNIGFASGYDLIGLDFTLSYSNALSFSKLEFTLPSNVGGPVSFLVTSGDLSGIPPSFNGNVGDFGYGVSVTAPDAASSALTFSGFPLSSVTLSGPVLLKATFLTSTIGQSAILLAGSSSSNFAPLDPDTFSSSALVTVSAVPEPEAWLMLLGGLGMIAALGRRRQAARR